MEEDLGFCVLFDKPKIALMIGFDQLAIGGR